MRGLTSFVRFQMFHSQRQTSPIRIAPLFTSLFIAGVLLAGCAALPTDQVLVGTESVQPDSSPAPNQPGSNENEIEREPENSGDETGLWADQAEPESTQVTPTEEPQPATSSVEVGTSTAPGGADEIPWSEVEMNSTMESCWIVLRQEVYDFGPVVQQHPFGAQLSNAVCGKDATELFEANADIYEVILQLEPYYLGSVG